MELTLPRQVVQVSGAPYVEAFMRAFPVSLVALLAALVVAAPAGAAYPKPAPQAYHGQIITKNPEAPPAANPVIAGYTGGFPVAEFNAMKADAAEPTIGVDKDGDAYVAGAAFDGALPFAGNSTFYRSLDDGRTWERRAESNSAGIDPPNDLDPYVWVDPDYGRIFEVPLLVAGSPINYSDDKGETWTSGFLTSTGANDHQTVITAKPPVKAPSIKPSDERFPKIFYYCINAVSSQSCSRSTDSGQTFQPTLNPAWTYSGCRNGSLGGQLASDSQGRIFVPTGRCDMPEIAISEDGGDTWTRTFLTTEISSAVSHTAVAVDRADNLFYTWMDTQHHRMYLSVSTDHGTTWSPPRNITPPDVKEVNFPAITAGDPGRIAITFPGTVADHGGDPAEVKKAQDCLSDASLCDRNRPWDTFIVMSTNALDANPTFTSAAVSPPEDPIHRGNCTGRCAGMFDFMKIVTSPADGAFWATATDTCLPENACADGRAGEGVPSETSGKGYVARQVGGPKLVGQLATPGPAAGGPSAIAPITDKSAPHIRGLNVRVGKRTKRRPTVYFSKISEAATLRIAIKKGKRSILVSRKFAPRGKGRIVFKKALRKGRYVLQAQATDAAGNRSRLYKVKFRVR
jgi:hypothetical protein